MSLLETTHWLDISLVAVVVVGAAIGAWRGVLRQTVRLITYVISFYLTMHLHEPVEAFIKTRLQEVADEISRTHSFLATLMGVYLGLYLVTLLGERVLKALFLRPTDREINSTLDVVGLRPLDRFLGACLGTIVAALLVGALLLSISLKPDAQIEKELAGSRLRPHVLKNMQEVLVAVPESYKAELQAALERLRQASVKVATEVTKDGMHQAAKKAENAAKKVEQAGGQEQVPPMPMDTQMKR